MIIANIITDNKLDLPLEFNQVNKLEEISNNLPTLIIGWYKTKELYSNQDILDRKINETTFWTFKKSEQRDKHETELFEFIDFSYKYLIKDITYFFIDPLNYSLSQIKKIIKKLKESKDIISYKNNDMVYLYTDKIIFGIDLRLLKYMGFDIGKIIEKIGRITLVFLDNSEILIEYKSYIEKINNEIKYIPYLYSVKNENCTSSLLPIS